MPPTSEFTFDSQVWEWEGQSSWHFVSLPEDLADLLTATFGHLARGFKSLRVQVTIGDQTWRTSIFPDAKRGTYLLPVKKAVRSLEGLVAGSPVSVTLSLID